MDISYWIILLVLYYLLSFFLKRRRQKLTPRETEGEEPQGVELLDWFSRERLAKELGFSEVEEEELPETKEKEPGEKAPSTTIPLRERIITFEKELKETEPVRVETKPMPKMREVKAEPVLKKVSKPEWHPRMVRKVSALRLDTELPEITPPLFDEKSLLALFYPPKNLRELIVAREILGQPRAMRRYQSRLFR